MKKVFLAVGMFTAATFSSCNKSNGPKPTAADTKLLSELKEINRSFQTQTPANTAKRPNGWIVAGADLGGFCTGVGGMGWLGVTPVGGFVAGFVGGLCAAGASAAVYNSMSVGPINPDNPDNPPGPATDVTIYNITHHADPYVVANPYNNPLESVGIRHNELLRAYYTTPHPRVAAAPYGYFHEEDLTSDEINSISTYGMTPMTSATAYLQTHTIGNVADLHDYINSSSASLEVKHVINLLYDGLDACSNAETRVHLINDYENAVINSSLSDVDAQTILGSLAVGKHSIVLWSSN